MMEACEIYDVPETAVLPEDNGFPAGAVPEAPERRCYTVEDLQDILMCSRTTVYDLLKTNQFRYLNSAVPDTGSPGKALTNGWTNSDPGCFALSRMSFPGI